MRFDWSFWEHSARAAKMQGANVTKMNRELFNAAAAKGVELSRGSDTAAAMLMGAVFFSSIRAQSRDDTAAIAVMAACLVPFTAFEPKDAA